MNAKISFYNVLLFCVLCISVPAFADDAKVKIAVIGDSTVCEYPEDNPNRGWGHYIGDYFNDRVEIINMAKSGRSTKTFIQEGLWEKTLAEKPDYVLIQFGHNDSHSPEKPEATDAATDYREYLKQYVNEAKEIGATPIFITPMHRRTFNADGTLKDNLQPYAGAMKDVAAEMDINYVDLHSSSGILFIQLGDEGSMTLASSPEDRTHFNEEGAKKMAELVMKILGYILPKDLQKGK
jgi:lysophospholipase L1-like esterase